MSLTKQSLKANKKYPSPYILMDFFFAAFSFRHFGHFTVNAFHIQRIVDLKKMDRSSVFDVMEHK
jgi:hypothetical protein